MFGLVHGCPHCGRSVLRYTGERFRGAPAIVDYPTDSPHVCIVESPRGTLYRVRRPEIPPVRRWGQHQECFCGTEVIHYSDGQKLDLDGSPHDCPHRH